MLPEHPARPQAGSRSSPLETFTAQTPEQARLLLDIAYQRVLGAVMQKELTASEVAQDAEITLKQAHHRLTRLLGAGLIVICAERKRGGRAVKVYRAVAGAIRLPFALTEADDLLALLHDLHRPIVNSYLKQMTEVFRHGADELRFYTTPQGGVDVNFGGPQAELARPAFGSLGEHDLTLKTALELERRLREIQRWLRERECEEKDLPDADSYITGLMLTPGRVED